MKPTRVRILGATGYLGSYLAKELAESGDIEITDDDYSIDYLINCMGYVDVAGCESNPERSMISNCGKFVTICDKTKPRAIINMSSYFVYDADSGVFDTNYARHKQLADVYTESMDGAVLVLGKLFGKSPNQQKRFPESVFDGEVYAEMIDHPFTHLFTVLKAVCGIIYNQEYTIACIDGSMSPYEFALRCKAIGSELDTNKLVKPLSPLNPFDDYGNFISMNDDKTQLYERIERYKKEMKC